MMALLVYFLLEQEREFSYSLQLLIYDSLKDL